MKKRLLTVLMILMLLFNMMPMQAFAEKPEAEAGLKYLNIGDSIAAGLSALPNDYFAQYAEYLGETELLRVYPGPFIPGPWSEGAVNLGVPGLDSMELLYELEMAGPTVLKSYIFDADIISISIGGNNLLTPVIGSVFMMYGLAPTASMEELMDAIVSAGKDGPFGWDVRLAAFTASALSSVPTTLGSTLEDRTAQFLLDWPAILDEIEEINPDAQIIAMTLYNPIEKEDNELLFNRYKALVSPMNMAIRNSEDRIMIADVEKSFDNKPDAVDFRLTWMDEMPPVLIDPHPTTLGHELIFKAIKKLGNPESFK